MVVDNASADSTRIVASKTKLKLGQSVEFTFPGQTADAFPGFDPARTAIQLSPPSGGARFDLTCQRVTDVKVTCTVGGDLAGAAKVPGTLALAPAVAGLGFKTSTIEVEKP